MKNKIFGSIIIILAVIGSALGVFFITTIGYLGWLVLAGSAFLVLVGLVVYRKGVAGVVRSISDGTPKDLR